jgi:aquaporin-4
MARNSLQDLKSPKFWLAVVAEFLGTCLLVLVACGSCANFDKDRKADFVQIALAFGFSVATIVWSIAHVSGGHINPAVTIGFLVTRKISILRATLYIVAQSLGAVVGASLLMLLSPTGSNDALGTTSPNTGVSMIQTFVVELVISFVLVWTVFATCDSQRTDLAGSGPLAIGLSIAMCHLWAIPYTGSGMNPARALGSALVSGYLKENAGIHALYWVGPLIGGSLAGLGYDLLFATNASIAKVKAFFSRRDYDDDQFDRHGHRVAPADNSQGINLKDAPAA